jgi:small subunit ribosomal protein S6
MYLREYETIYILRPDLSENEVTELNQRFANVLDTEGGKVLKQNVWGKRKLAYEIKKHPKGIYVVLNYLAQPTAVKELERNFKILETALKFQTIKIADNVDVDTRVAEQEAEDKSQAAKEQRKLEEAQKMEAAAEAAQAEMSSEEEVVAEKDTSVAEDIIESADEVKEEE